MAPVESAIAMSAGVPSRPGSAKTTPRTWTRAPIADARASMIDTSGPAVGEGAGVGLPVGEGVAVGFGV